MATSASSPTQPVLAAVDLAFHSDTLIARALAEAEGRQCPLLLLHVVHEAANAPGYYHRHGYGPTVPMTDIASALLAEHTAAVIGTRPDAGSVPVYRRVVEGLPATRIAEVAEQADAQALVLFSHGRDALGRLWHGSVTAGVRKRCRRELVVLTESEDFPPQPLASTPLPDLRLTQREPG